MAAEGDYIMANKNNLIVKIGSANQTATKRTDTR